MILDWTNITEQQLDEMAVSMSVHSLERAAERSNEPIGAIRREVENCINKAERQLLGTRTGVVIKTRDGFNIVGQVLQDKLGPIFKVITLMWKKNFVPNNPTDKVINLNESFITIDITPLVNQLQLLTSQRVELEDHKTYTILPVNLNQKKTELLIQFIEYINNELGLNNSKHSEVNLIEDRSLSEILSNTTTAFYCPDNEDICVYIGNRAFADWLRSLAHEFTHKAQFHKGNLLKVATSNGLENLQALEDEANFMAGRLVRAFGQSSPEIYDENLLQ